MWNILKWQDSIQLLDFVMVVMDLGFHTSKEFLGQLNKYQLIKKDSVPWTQFPLQLTSSPFWPGNPCSPSLPRCPTGPWGPAMPWSPGSPLSPFSPGFPFIRLSGTKTEAPFSPEAPGGPIIPGWPCKIIYCQYYRNIWKYIHKGYYQFYLLLNIPACLNHVVWLEEV